MPRPRVPVRRSPQLAWYITAPLAALTLAIALPLALKQPASISDVPNALLLFALFVAADTTSLNFTVRRHSFPAPPPDTPPLLGLFFLPPGLILISRLSPLLLVQGGRLFPPVKLWFNLASSG